MLCREDSIDSIQKEVSLLAQNRSPHIIQFFGSIIPPGTSQLQIIMELMAASVSDLVRAGCYALPACHISVSQAGCVQLIDGPLDEASSAYILQSILRALEYLHSENRLHRDVKAANVLLAANGTVKMTDFGVSAQV